MEERTTARTSWSSTIAVALVFLSLLNSATAQLSFIWYFDQQNDAAIPQCSTLDISIGEMPNATVQAVPPYYLMAYPADATPSVFDASAANGGVYAWSVGYVPGTQFMLGMVDSKGTSGGVVRVYTVSQGSSSCQMYQTDNSGFSYTINPAAQPRTCQNVDFTVTGGVAPYTVTTAISMDTAINQTFPNSSISVPNTLSGGATYILALSDSTGSYAASPDLIYSGGGGDTSCLVNTPSSTPSNTPTSSHSSKTPAIIGAVVAIGAIALAAGAFFIYRRRKRAQQDHLSTAQLSAMNGGAGGGRNGSYMNGNGGSGNGREKFMSPMTGGTAGSGAGGAGGAAGGGMWRPESPTEYPGITSAPVRFRVTNPDDDARSERSFKAFGVGGRNGPRRSSDTVRTNKNDPRPWSGSPSTSSGGGYPTGRDRSQRQSLIESDANALYPPTTSSLSYQRGSPGGANMNTSTYNSGRTWTTSSGIGGGADGPSSSSAGSYEDADQPWPTYASVASSETEDHYEDLPASSAGILGLNRRNTRDTNLGTPSSAALSRSNSHNSENESDLGEEDMYRDIEHLRHRDIDGDGTGSFMDATAHSPLDLEPRWESHTRPGITNSPSNAYGSPFADSQRVR